LYRHDTVFTAALSRGTDVVTLVLSIPLLVFALRQYRRGSLRGGLWLMGALTGLLYVATSYALGTVAYNDLFLVYVVLCSVSLFALLLTFRSFDLQAVAARVSNRMPRRGLACFLFISGAVTLAVWLVTPVTGLITRDTPAHLDIYTTLFTNAFDMAVIVPVLVTAGVLIRRRDPLGYLLAFPLFVLEMFLVPMIVAQTVSQVLAGVSLGAGEIIGPVAGFTLFGLLATGAVAAIHHNLVDAAPAPTEQR
jgi:hypothetical protein